MKQQRHSSASSSSDQCSQSVLGHLMQAYWEVRAFYEKKKIGNEGLKAFKKARIEALKPPLAVQPLEITPLVLRELKPIKDRPMAALKRADANGTVSSKCPIIPLEHLEATPSMQYWTHTEVNINITPLVLRELKPIKDRPMAALKRADANGTVSSKCPIIPLEHLEATPSMQYWTHTEVNINAEDEFTLSHIPFLGDAEDDTSFCADLMKTFPDGIHGTVNGCGEYINDYILYYTVKRVEERFPNSLKTIFKVVHEQFPNKASVHELFSLYPDLQRRFLPESIVKQKFTNDRGELVFNFSNERLLNSYELLLCHKCFSYDCIMHNAVTNNGYGDSKKMVRSKRQSSGGFGRHDGWSSYGQKLKKRPCSDKCYINIAVQTVSNSGSGKKGNKLKSSIVSSRQQQLIIDIAGGVLPAKWTPHEEAIFNVLRSTGEEEYCRITIVLNLSLSATRKKTCQEVHEYACRAGPQSPRLEMPSSPVKNAKCRKNNGHRQFRAIKWANTNGTVENHGRFIPCKAKCDCLLNTCQCVKVNNLCTKYCGCVDCKNRFPGCRCLKTIFKVVHEQFPNKASVHELFSLYPDLQRRFLPESIVKQKFTNDRGELVFNFSNERLLNSYELLLCHKCFSYDCIMHNAVTNNGYGDSKKMVRSKRQSSGGFGRHDGWSSYGQKLKKRPCSDKCYINIAVQTVSNSGSGKKGNKLKSSIVSSRQQQLIIDIAGGVLPAKWTPHEEAIFNVLRSTGEEEYCRITIVLNLSLSATRKKTCQEVHEYACRAGPQSPRLEMPSSPVKNAKCRKNNGHRQFRAIKWANTNGTVENHGRFIPCKAKCDCLLNTCQCVKVNNLCTKYCGCVDCKNRFPGCRCAPGNCRTKQCQCYFASWECDPDVCKSCNCDKLDGSGEPICKNVSIQRGLQKRLIVAPSQVAGWGCFANEDIEKNDFVSEYCGEVISTEESERRGKIYDRIKCSYLFGLNDEQVVDATRVGNVIRFANHSQNPNCRAKVIVVNGDHKIGIFAQRHIKCGEELFFDYGTDSFWKQQIDFVPKELAQMLRHKERLGGFGGGGPGIARGGSV
uniref:[histone H3]-lysine(27) N-trimethyltransferase n=1 Tax=Globodera pallida TaxID=36090 RepID=A0A183BJI0_GLOPA